MVVIKVAEKASLVDGYAYDAISAVNKKPIWKNNALETYVNMTRCLLKVINKSYNNWSVDT